MREAQTRSYPGEPGGSSNSVIPFPTIEEIEQHLRRLGEMGDPVGQVAYLEKIEAELRDAYLAGLGGRGKTPGSSLFALRRYVRCEKEKAEEWREQYLARKARSQNKLRGRAFTAPSGSEELQNHLRELRQCNETLRELAQDHWTVSHNRALGTTGYDHEEVKGWFAGIESKIEDRQEQIIKLIQAHIDELESLQDRKDYLRQVLLWYEEADYIGRHRIGRHRYGELHPFEKIVEGIKRLSPIARQEGASKTSNGDGQEDSNCCLLKANLSDEEAHYARTVISILKSRGKGQFSTYSKLNRRLELEDLNYNSDDMLVEGSAVTKGAKRAAQRLAGREIKDHRIAGKS